MNDRADPIRLAIDNAAPVTAGDDSLSPPSRPAGASPAPPASFEPPSRPAGASPAPPPIGARDELGASEGTTHGGGAGEAGNARDGGEQKTGAGEGRNAGADFDAGAPIGGGAGEGRAAADGGMKNALTPAELDLVRACAELDQNDRDNGRRLVMHCGADLAYLPGMGWLTWRGTHWQRDEGELNARLMAQNLVDRIKLEAFFIQPTDGQKALLEAAETAAKKPGDELTPHDRALIADGAKIRDQLRKDKGARRRFAVASGNASKTSAMLAQAASTTAVDQDGLDANGMAFNVANGTLKFSRVPDPECPDPDAVRMMGHVELAPHDRADMITKRAAVSYDPGAECPGWLAFLEKVQPDADMRLFLQVSHAYALFLGGNDEQKMIYHYGAGANGKSAFVETLGRLAGQYRAVVDPATITGDGNRQGQQASPDIARLFNVRLATVEELPRGTPLKENLIKAMTGGTRLTARFLLKEIFEFEPMFTPVLTGNDMPEVSGTDHGIWRRLLLVKWGVTIPEGEQQAWATVLERFDAERPGILNWLIEGLEMYLANGLKIYVPAAVTLFAEDYREERDPVGQFAAACLVRVIGHKVQAKAMYEAYLAWCEANGIKPYQQTNFGKRLAAMEFAKERTALVHYLDVQLVNVPDRFAPNGGNAPADPKGDPGWRPPEDLI